MYHTPDMLLCKIEKLEAQVEFLMKRLNITQYQIDNAEAIARQVQNFNDAHDGY